MRARGCDLSIYPSSVEAITFRNPDEGDVQRTMNGKSEFDVGACEISAPCGRATGIPFPPRGSALVVRPEHSPTRQIQTINPRACRDI